MESNPHSVLTRYYGAYRFHLEGDNTFFVVMSNVLAGLGEIQALFDLKGTTEVSWNGYELCVHSESCSLEA